LSCMDRSNGGDDAGPIHSRSQKGKKF
jgi:hypothetical protein